MFLLILYILAIYGRDMRIFDGISGFQWDSGNMSKNWAKHRVSMSECEEIFFNKPLVVADDEKHSGVEERFFALGKTDRGKRLFIVFTLRDNQIRIISARSMSKKERSIYEKQEKNDSEIQK